MALNTVLTLLIRPRCPRALSEFIELQLHLLLEKETVQWTNQTDPGRYEDQSTLDHGLR